MSVLTDNPEVAMAALAACIRKLGGTVVITDEETRPFSIASRIVDGKLHLHVMDYTPTATGGLT